MNLPLNGTVVVIDDDPKEALPLLKVLSKNKVPFTFFLGGEPDELPQKPISNISVLFLDLQLVSSSNTKIIRSSLIMNLKRIVSENNSPYVLILWSLTVHKYKEVIDGLFETELKCIRPIVSLSLQKADYFETDENGNKNPLPDFLNRLENKLKEELKQIGIFHLFVKWGNIVQQSASHTIKDIKEFTSVKEYGAEWNRNLSGVFLKLATAYAGKQLKSEDKKDIIKNSLLTFNGTFIDTLENTIRETDYSEIDVKFDSGQTMSEDISAKINSKLHLINAADINATRPGNVYEIIEENNFRVDVEELFNDFDTYSGKEDFLRKIKYILIEVSPTCDFAQNKWRLSRLLPGVMWPAANFTRKGKKNKEIGLIKTAEYIYASPIFEINDLTCKLVLDFRYLTALSFEELKDLYGPNNSKKSQELQLSFCLRHQMLVEIQSQLARHLNRPGVISL